MATNFNKAARAKIVRDFADINGGVFEPKAFLAHVRATGPDHPAWAWFDWDDGRAAEKYRVEQARRFVEGITIKYEIRTQKARTVRLVSEPVPAFISPLAHRRDGGGYQELHAGDVFLMGELVAQAARDGRAFQKRYAGAFRHAGADATGLERLLVALEAFHVPTAEAAE